MAYQPKSYKKFVATAATATLVASAIAPVASAATFTDVNSNYTEAVNYLVANKIAQGTSETTFGTTASITRGDAAVMIANALELNTSSAPDAGFKDLNTRVAGAVNALFAAKIIGGKSATSFAPDDKITRQEMAKVISLAYELDNAGTNNTFVDVNSNWDTYVDALVKNKVTLGKTPTTFGATQNVTRGEFALFVFRAETLVPATPEVVSVSAINAKEVQVKFNQPVKEASVITTGNLKTGVFKINNAEGNTLTSAASLSADGKTLTLVSNTTWSGNYTVESIANTAETLTGKFVSVYKAFFAASDTVRAEVTGVTFVDKYTYDVKFSEPVSSTGTLAYSYTDGTATPVVVTSDTLSADKKSVRLVFDPATLVNKEITVALPALTDFASNVSKPATAKVTISNADQSKPAISSVATTGFDGTNTSFQIKLSEAIKETGAITGITLNGAAVTATVDATDKTLINATVATKVKGSLLLYLPVDKLTDLNNNKNAEVGQFYTFTQDEAAPTVAGQAIERIGGVEHLVLTFNEEIGTVNSPANVAFVSVDQFGMPVTTTTTPVIAKHNVVNGKTKQIKVSLAGLADSKSYKVTFAAGLVVDNYNNSSAQIKDASLTTSTVNTGVGTDNVATIGLAPATPGKVTVSFSKPVNVASAQNVANYVVEDATVSSAVVTANAAGGATVELTLAEGTVETTGNFDVTVKPVQTFNSIDTANVLTKASVLLKENVKPVLSSNVLTSLTADSFTTKLTFNDSSVVDAAGLDYELYVNGVATGQSFTVGAITTGQVTVTWTDAGNAVSDLTAATSVKLVPVSTLDIKDGSGNTVKASDIVIK